jgi:polyadenylate-binding protein
VHQKQQATVHQEQQLSSQKLTDQLSSAHPSVQKQILGDKLYPLVAARHPAVAGKLTGMLLQMDNSEILFLLEDHVALQQELEKNYDALRSHLPSA